VAVGGRLTAPRIPRLIIAGPWLTMSGSRLMARLALRRASRPALLIAGRRVTLESAAPLIISAVLSVAAAFLAAGLFSRSALGDTLRPPGAEYYVIVAAGLGASLAIIASSFPLLRRLTGPESARDA